MIREEALLPLVSAMVNADKVPRRDGIPVTKIQAYKLQKAILKME